MTGIESERSKERVGKTALELLEGCFGEAERRQCPPGANARHHAISQPRQRLTLELFPPNKKNQILVKRSSLLDLKVYYSWISGIETVNKEDAVNSVREAYFDKAKETKS